MAHAIERTSGPRYNQRAMTQPGTVRAGASRTNSVTASQARAARRREARRDEQAVAAWLRELSGRAR